MVENTFFVVSYEPSGEFNDIVLTRILDRAPDWVQFAPNNWLIWTNRSPKTWYERIKPIMRDGDNVLIFEANMTNRSGFMPSSFWKFIRAKLKQ